LHYLKKVHKLIDENGNGNSVVMRMGRNGNDFIEMGGMGTVNAIPDTSTLNNLLLLSSC